MSVTTMQANEPKDEPAQHSSTASEQCIVESSASVVCEGTVVLKGLPSEHVHADCMGEYVKQQSMLSGRSLYVGGRDGDMALYFQNNSWVVKYEDTIGVGASFLSADDRAIAPERITAPWSVGQGYHPAPSLRVRKFLGRETILEISGLPSGHYASSCVGRYTRETCKHNEKSTYKGTRQADGKAIWFCEDSWHVGSKEDIGTLICAICVDDSARTPDAVQSMWMVGTLRAEYDERIQVCGASAQQHSSATASHHQAQRSSASQSSAPRKLAVVGSNKEGESFDGTYTKLQGEVGSRVVYEGGRNGKRAIWYLPQAGPRSLGTSTGTWLVGAAQNVGTGSCCMYTSDSAVTPDVVTESWSVPLMVPSSSIRVTKSKKKHTKVIEVKGAPTDGGEHLALMNGKYRPSFMVGGRPTFKGGQDGRRVLWFDERRGKWCGTHEVWVGKGICFDMEATDTAASPNAVKAPWHVLNGFEPSPYPNVIVPSVEAAEKEIPRLLQLKMSELLVAQHMRCLGCGHEYTTQAEVVFQIACMHHHCVCCGEKHGGDVCAVCAE
jgi:hypothetical protein